MGERKREKLSAFKENTFVITEIRATRGRNAEHFIKIFRHESDNIAGASLGVLLGAFEIDDQSEDSRYIVNFLFSVAKNEYFCNPRRGAMESFEAALHKINIALAEIVKHGNIGWLGKFHGTIAVLEKNAIHLSATGDGRIYLFRNENLSHISENLASPDAAEHPIKTFVEISSGRLSPNDRLLFVLPKIFTLLDEETIARQARRMDREHFSQFIRTAMINNIEQGGALIVDIEEAPNIPPDYQPKTARQRSPKSYFSETAFETKGTESVAAALSEGVLVAPSQKPDYTDAKTGHIYIQGTQEPLSVEESRFAQYLENLFLSGAALREDSNRLIRKSLRRALDRAKLFFIISGEWFHQSIGPFFRKYIRLSRNKSYSSVSPKKSVSSLSDTLPADNTSPDEFSKIAEFHEEPSPSPTPRNSSRQMVPTLRKIVFRSGVYWKKWGEALSRQASKLFRSLLAAMQSLFGIARRIFLRLPIRWRIISLFILGLFLLGISSWLISSWNTPSSSSEKIPEIQNIPLEDPIRAQESQTSDLPPIRTLGSNPGTITTAYLDGSAVIITADTIVIPALNTSATIPAGSGTPRFVAPMDDLHALFIFTDRGKLLSFTPANQSFSENSFPIDAFAPAAIGAYLTYLYAIDTTGHTVMRFPRVQGGFGDGYSWLKEALPPSQHPSLVVNDSLYIFSGHALVQFSRGKKVRSFEMPRKEPESLILSAEPDNTRIIGLDTSAHRIIVWNTDGAILQQYFSDMLSSATGIALHGNTIAFSTPNGVSEIDIP